MKKRILTYLKYFFLTLVIIIPLVICIGVSIGASAHYGDDPGAYNCDQDGPYIFYQQDSLLAIKYVRGNREEGYSIEEKITPIGTQEVITCHNPFDGSSFDFSLQADFESPKSTYDDGQKILAISDIESNYLTFRNFLIQSKVIDRELNWTFGNGHLVLVGDFVDRGFFTTQVLWFIYKLEQEANAQGGVVHFIIGNHELKAMQGNTRSASPKYMHIASVLGKQQYDFYSANSFLGRWLSSKNAMEVINGHLFVHGGLHPEIADLDWSIEKINNFLRANYYQAYFTVANRSDEEKLLLSTKTGPCWYRGFFKDDLEQEEIDRSLEKFNAQTVVVGHTIQSKVNRQFNGKVIGIDVKHPGDHYKQWPRGKSEALIIDGDKFYRVFADGERKEI